MNVNQWLVAPANNGAAYNVPEGGIPGDDPVWITPLSLGANHCVADASTLYLQSRKPRSGLVAFWALRLSDGGEVWSSDPGVEEEEMYGALNRDWVMLGVDIFAKESGRLLRSFRDQGVKSRSGGRIATAPAGFIHEVAQPSAGAYLLDVATGHGEFISEGLTHFIQGDTERYLYGRRNGRLVCFDTVDRCDRWSVGLPLRKNGAPFMPSYFPAICGERLFVHVNFDTLWCLDVGTGDFLWAHGPERFDEDSIAPHKGPPGRLAVCAEHIFLLTDWRQGGLKCYSTADGSPVWEVSLDEPTNLLIAGDLVFHNELSPRSRRGNYLYARDRFTGTQVWKSAAPMDSGRMIAAANKLFIYTTWGDNRCYEWTERYVSPARGSGGAGA